MECTKFLLEIKWPSKIGIMFTGITFSHPKVSAMGSKFSVLCHVATGSLVSHHGLRKYWHFVLYEINPTLCIQAKRKKEKGGGSKKLCLFQRQQIEGKRIWSFNKLKEKYLLADRWFVCTLNNSINKTNISFLNRDSIKTKYFLIILSRSNIYPRIDISFLEVTVTSQGLNQMYSYPFSGVQQYTTAQWYPIWRLTVKKTLQEKMKIHQAENLKLVLLSNKKNT